jgi:hypothetical protein
MQRKLGQRSEPGKGDALAWHGHGILEEIDHLLCRGDGRQGLSRYLGDTQRHGEGTQENSGPPRRRRTGFCVFHDDLEGFRDPDLVDELPKRRENMVENGTAITTL